MSFERAPAIAVIATAQWAENADSLIRNFDVSSGGSLPIIRITATDVPAALDRIGLVAGCLMLGFERAAIEAIRARYADIPLVVVSEDAQSNVTCWFPKLPPTTVLVSLFRGIVPPAESPNPLGVRRKTDMIVGSSGAVGELINGCSRLAASRAPVLVSGETGTGKELVARALHYSGPRAARPFIAINCAAIPETLIEAELFGHQRGAFTGAVATRAGAFESAAGGTLFLDEIGEMPLMMQPKLLRVLDTGEVTRLGSSTPVSCSARVVAATNRSLETEVRAGRFRQDLYYRISIHLLHVPPLRDRADDIPAIVKHHLSMIAERERCPIPRLTSSAIAKLIGHSWPGNVRELVATVERAVLVAKDNMIDAIDISFAPSDVEGPNKSGMPAYREAKAEFERAYFDKLMRTTEGNVSLAASIAQKTRKEIYDALKRTGVNKPITARSGMRRDRLVPGG